MFSAINYRILLVFCINCFGLLPYAYSQGISINTIGAAPDASALLDIDAAPANNQGLLIPRLTTAQRDAIVSPAVSLLIYNITTDCLEMYSASAIWVSIGCGGCQLPGVLTASASPNPICEGSTLTLTGGATGATSWNWSGPNSYTSTSQSPTIAGIALSGAGVYTLQACNACGCVDASTAAVSVSQQPTTANAGADINPACGVNTATLAGNTPTVGTGTWTVVSGTATITTPSSPTSGVTGLAVLGTATLRWTISNAPCANSFDEVVITTTSCSFSCGSPFTDARDGKAYNTVLIGSQCWMAENLAWLPSVAEPGTGSETDPYYYVYGYNGTDVAAAKATVNYSTYGVLYNWAAAMNGAASSNSIPSGVQGICPASWHLPSDAEWCVMENTVEAGTDAACSGISWRGTNTGGDLKQTGTTLWTTPNTGATNSSGFTALPSGNRGTGGLFYGVGYHTYWWSSTEYIGIGAWHRYLYYLEARMSRNLLGKADGVPCRCIKD